MEDALGGAERDRRDEERAADGDDPAAAPVRAPQLRTPEDRGAADDREAEQPAALPAERLVQQAQRTGRAAEEAALPSSTAARPCTA